jgi:hypothetical protein
MQDKDVNVSAKSQAQDSNRVEANVIFSLQQVSYISLPENSNTNLVLHADDSVQVKNVDAKGFDLLYLRIAEVQPSSFFKTTVAFQIHGDFTSESQKIFEKEPEEPSKWVTKYKENIVSDQGLPSRASVIISTLTMTAGFTPGITAPGFIRPVVKKIVEEKGEQNHGEKSSK